MLRRNWIFRDRIHPCDTDIRWWINLQQIQIQTRKNCDHCWIHWTGLAISSRTGSWNWHHCCMSSYTKVFASCVSFQDVCGELFGMGQKRPVQRPPLFLTFCGERFGCPWLSKKWKSRRKRKNKNIQSCRRPTASSRQIARPISIEFARSLAVHWRWNNGFSRSKSKNKRLAIDLGANWRVMHTNRVPDLSTV